MSLALAVVLCAGSGFFLVSLFWTRRFSHLEALLLCALSIPFGLGLFSVTFFVARVFAIRAVLAIDIVIFVILAAFAFTRLRTMRGPSWTDTSASRPPRILTITFLIALAVAIYCSIVRICALPHGDGWDAFAIWNLHARFLFRGGVHWRDGFTSLLPWSHPDYPLLIPSAIAHFWFYLKRENPWIPGLVALAFLLAIAGLIYSSLFILRGRQSAMFGTLALLATPAFITQGTSLYADVPLSFYYLATIALLCMHSCAGCDPSASRLRSPLLLAGLAAGFSAWTKNEGLLFLASVAAAQLLVNPFSRRKSASDEQNPSSNWASLLTFLLGAFPALLIVAWFKHAVAPPGDLFSSPSAALAKLQDLSRYWITMRWFAKESLRFGEWFLMPGTLLLAALCFVLPQKASTPIPDGVRLSVLALVFTLSGYFLIYLITPYDLYWHLRFSLNRLFLQLWPTVLFTVFLALRMDERSCNVSK